MNRGDAVLVALNRVHDVAQMAEVEGRVLDPVEVGVYETPGFVVFRPQTHEASSSIGTDVALFQLVHLGVEDRAYRGRPNDRQFSETVCASYEVRASGSRLSDASWGYEPSVAVRELKSPAVKFPLDVRDSALAFRAIFSGLLRQAIPNQPSRSDLYVEVDLDYGSANHAERIAQLAGMRIADTVLRSQGFLDLSANRVIFGGSVPGDDPDDSVEGSQTWASCMTSAALAFFGRSGNVYLPDQRRLYPEVDGSATYGDANSSVSYVEYPTGQQRRTVLRLVSDVRATRTTDALMHEPGISLVIADDLRFVESVPALIGVINSVWSNLVDPHHRGSDLAVARRYLLADGHFSIHIPGITKGEAHLFESMVPGVKWQRSTGTFAWRVQEVRVNKHVAQLQEALAGR